ncbi:hypothetical protein NUW58_g2960 [Xylaria curta]|uniref:Uncharacterized protein n=1 Tax=Xylaria curta TaxID=42375 RepID=A0ACC1PD36_9PEZI|nr:hypothetical protein NUW58_g2960 [Xylaria curta]
MKTSILTLVLLAAAGSVDAKSCKKGGFYCGQSLLNRGNYDAHIRETLKDNKQPTDQAHILNSRFRCDAGGDITFLAYCSRGCSGVGSSDDDYCL